MHLHIKNEGELEFLMTAIFCINQKETRKRAWEALPSTNQTTNSLRWKVIDSLLTSTTLDAPKWGRGRVPTTMEGQVNLHQQLIMLTSLNCPPGVTTCQELVSSRAGLTGHLLTMNEWTNGPNPGLGSLGEWWGIMPPWTVFSFIQKGTRPFKVTNLGWEMQIFWSWLEKEFPHLWQLSHKKLKRVKELTKPWIVELLCSLPRSWE